MDAKREADKGSQEQQLLEPLLGVEVKAVSASSRATDGDAYKNHGTCNRDRKNPAKQSGDLEGSYDEAAVGAETNYLIDGVGPTMQKRRGDPLEKRPKGEEEESTEIPHAMGVGELRYVWITFQIVWPCLWVLFEGYPYEGFILWIIIPSVIAFWIMSLLDIMGTEFLPRWIPWYERHFPHNILVLDCTVIQQWRC